MLIWTVCHLRSLLHLTSYKVTCLTSLRSRFALVLILLSRINLQHKVKSVTNLTSSRPPPFVSCLHGRGVLSLEPPPYFIHNHINIFLWPSILSARRGRVNYSSFLGTTDVRSFGALVLVVYSRLFLGVRKPYARLGWVFCCERLLILREGRSL